MNYELFISWHWTTASNDWHEFKSVDCVSDICQTVCLSQETRCAWSASFSESTYLSSPAYCCPPSLLASHLVGSADLWLAVSDARRWHDVIVSPTKYDAFSIHEGTTVVRLVVVIRQNAAVINRNGHHWRPVSHLSGTHRTGRLYVRNS